MRLSFLFLALSTLLMAGPSCQSSSATGPADDPTAASFETVAQASDYETVAQGQYGNYDFEEPRNLVFDSEPQFASFWEALHSSASETPTAPGVNFASNTRVVAVMFGSKPTGGYDIEVTSVERSGDTATVHITETVPGPRCSVSLALTAPYHIIRVDDVPAGGFTYETTREETSC